MRRKLFGTTLLTALVLSACVTINVYFPAAEAQEAAKEFVDKVIGEDGKPVEAKPQEAPPEQPPAESGDGDGFSLLSFFIADAHAQTPDITLKTPAIQAIQSRMAQRFQRSLQAHFDSGALGFGRDGLIVVRDAAKLGLKDRVSVNQLVAEDNKDRKAVYREIAVANKHPEWEQQIRETFAKQWVASARSGWWYQDAGGAWKQK